MGTETHHSPTAERVSSQMHIFQIHLVLQRSHKALDHAGSRLLVAEEDTTADILVSDQSTKGMISLVYFS